MSKKLAHGIWPALCTPFDDSGQHLAEKRVAPLIEALLDAGANGLFVCGSTGEAAFMTLDERHRMAESALQSVAGAVPVILHVGATSTDDAVDLARRAAGIGADAIASVAPVDHPNDLEAAATHYAAIGATTDLPFYVYWVARTADSTVAPEQYLEAMERVPNFAGFKFTDTNFFLFQRLVDLGQGSLNAITGPDEMCLAGMVMGSDAAIGSCYNIMPRIFLKMRRAFESGDIACAMSHQKRANRAISRLHDVGVMGAIKTILRWRGLPVGPPRSLDQVLDTAAENRLRRNLDALGFDVE